MKREMSHMSTHKEMLQDHTTVMWWLKTIKTLYDSICMIIKTLESIFQCFLFSYFEFLHNSHDDNIYNLPNAFGLSSD